LTDAKLQKIIASLLVQYSTNFLQLQEFSALFINS